MSDQIKIFKRGDAEHEQRGPSLRKVSEGLRQLSPEAVRLLREAFSLIDKDGLGAITKDQLQSVTKSVGLYTDDATLSKMLDETGEPITFPNFLAVMADQISGLVSHEKLDGLLGAFSNDSEVDVADLTSVLLERGLDRSEVDQLMAEFTKQTQNGTVFDRKSFLNTLSI